MSVTHDTLRKAVEACARLDQAARDRGLVTSGVFDEGEGQAAPIAEVESIDVDPSEIQYYAESVHQKGVVELDQAMREVTETMAELEPGLDYGGECGTMGIAAERAYAEAERELKALEEEREWLDRFVRRLTALADQLDLTATEAGRKIIVIADAADPSAEFVLSYREDYEGYEQHVEVVRDAVRDISVVASQTRRTIGDLERDFDDLRDEWSDSDLGTRRSDEDGHGDGPDEDD